MNSDKPILLTGAAGALGTLLRPRLVDTYGSLVSTDIVELDALLPGERFVRADLTDMHAVDRMVQGAGAILHFGGIAEEAAFDKLLAANVSGTWNLLEAARRHGAGPVIIASSHHVVGFYEQGFPIATDVSPRPDSLYGFSKASCEALASLYADKYGMDIVSLRIGSVQPVPRIARHLSTWLSHRDLFRLVEASLEAPAPGHSVIYGVSANSRNWWINSSTQYRPLDDAETFVDQIDAGGSDDPNAPENRFQGGAIAAEGFSGRDTKRP